MAVSVAELMTISVFKGGGRRHSVWSGNYSRYSCRRGHSNEWHQGKSNTFRKVVKNNNRSAVKRVVCDPFPEKWSFTPARATSVSSHRRPGILAVGQGLEPLLHGAGFGLARIQELIRSSESEVSRERLDPI
jgi:hypothetical protein